MTTIHSFIEHKKFTKKLAMLYFTIICNMIAMQCSGMEPLVLGLVRTTKILPNGLCFMKLDDMNHSSCLYAAQLYFQANSNGNNAIPKCVGGHIYQMIRLSYVRSIEACHRQDKAPKKAMCITRDMVACKKNGFYFRGAHSPNCCSALLKFKLFLGACMLFESNYNLRDETSAIQYHNSIQSGSPNLHYFDNLAKNLLSFNSAYNTNETHCSCFTSYTDSCRKQMFLRYWRENFIGSNLSLSLTGLPGNEEDAKFIELLTQIPLGATNTGLAAIGNGSDFEIDYIPSFLSCPCALSDNVTIPSNNDLPPCHHTIRALYTTKVTPLYIYIPLPLDFPHIPYMLGDYLDMMSIFWKRLSIAEYLSRLRLVSSCKIKLVRCIRRRYISIKVCLTSQGKADPDHVLSILHSLLCQMQTEPSIGTISINLDILQTLTTCNTFSFIYDFINTAKYLQSKLLEELPDGPNVIQFHVHTYAWLFKILSDRTRWLTVIITEKAAADLPLLKLPECDIPYQIEPQNLTSKLPDSSNLVKMFAVEPCNLQGYVSIVYNMPGAIQIDGTDYAKLFLIFNIPWNSCIPMEIILECVKSKVRESLNSQLCDIQVHNDFTRISVCFGGAKNDVYQTAKEYVQELKSTQHYSIPEDAYAQVASKHVPFNYTPGQLVTYAMLLNNEGFHDHIHSVPAFNGERQIDIKCVVTSVNVLLIGEAMAAEACEISSMLEAYGNGRVRADITHQSCFIVINTPGFSGYKYVAYRCCLKAGILEQTETHQEINSCQMAADILLLYIIGDALLNRFSISHPDLDCQYIVHCAGNTTQLTIYSSHVPELEQFISCHPMEGIRAFAKNFKGIGLCERKKQLLHAYKSKLGECESYARLCLDNFGHLQAVAASPERVFSAMGNVTFEEIEKRFSDIIFI